MYLRYQSSKLQTLPKVLRLIDMIIFYNFIVGMHFEKVIAIVKLIMQKPWMGVSLSPYTSEYGSARSERVQQ